MDQDDFKYLGLAEERYQQELNRESFTFKQSLLEVPELSLPNLQELVLRLPPDCVYASSSKVDIRQDLDKLHKTHAVQTSLEQAVMDLENSGTFVMVRSPEQDPSLKNLFSDLQADVQTFINARHSRLSNSTLYLFLASPGGITPFHIDRYSTFLFQLQGSKEVHTWTPWNRELISDEEMEAFFAKVHERAPQIKDAFVDRAKINSIAPGDALHIPFVAPHLVKNGGQVSASLSIIFNTRETTLQAKAMEANNYLRRKLGMSPTPVNLNPLRDKLKAYSYLAARKLRS